MEEDNDIPVPAGDHIKRWMSEPNLLGDYDDDWLTKNSPVTEDSVSFTDEVVQPNLRHVTKERVQFRPKRRPPSREFIKSRASMDFEFAVPEQINEENEDDIAEEVETLDDLHPPPVGHHPGGTPLPDGHHPGGPPPPVKPKDYTAWRLPSIDQEMVQTPSSESKRSVTKQESIATTSSETSEDSVDSTPGKKHKRRPRIKMKMFKMRRRGKETENKPAVEATREDTNMNLRHCMSVDSGSRPLGEDQPKSWLRQRWRRKSQDKRNLNWLLGLFHKKGGAHEGAGTTSATPPVVRSNHGNHTNNSHDIDKSNGEVSVNRSNNELINGEFSEKIQNEETERHDTVSDLKKKFENGF